MKKASTRKAGFVTLLALIALCTGTQADVVLFSNVNGVNGSSIGYFNPGASWGDLVRIGGSGTITSIRFDVANAYSNYTNGVFKISFFNVDTGNDGLLGTSDDKIGSLIGDYTSPTMSIATETRTTISGFSIDVPDTFIYTVKNHGGLLSYTMNTTATAPTVGIQYDDVLFFSSAELGPGASVQHAATYKNYQVELAGSVIPEPATASMLALVSAIGFIIRRRFCS
jgi:hypothetical protein